MFKDKKKKKLKTTWQKIWYFIWEDDSVLSWVVNIVIAFVLIKFVVYPGLGWIFATSHPVVAVVSGSMEHKTVNPCMPGKVVTYSDGMRKCIEYDKEHFEICGSVFEERKKVNLDFFWDTCGEFYKGYNINKLKFDDYSFKHGFNTGDIIVLFGKKPEKLNIGDVIVFRRSDQYQSDPIIHRIIKIWTAEGQYFYKTKGDHNPTTYSFEATISEDQVIGKAVFKIPFLGNIKIWFVDLLRALKLNAIIKVFN